MNYTSVSIKVLGNHMLRVKWHGNTVIAINQKSFTHLLTKVIGFDKSTAKTVLGQVDRLGFGEEMHVALDAAS